MKNIDMKALRIVIDGLVDIGGYIVEPRGTFRAVGTVQGEHGIYTVKVEPGGNRCGCEYGTQIPGVTCSHVRALELAVWLEATREKEHV